MRLVNLVRLKAADYKYQHGIYLNMPKWLCVKYRNFPSGNRLSLILPLLSFGASSSNTAVGIIGFGQWKFKYMRPWKFEISESLKIFKKSFSQTFYYFTFSWKRGLLVALLCQGSDLRLSKGQGHWIKSLDATVLSIISSSMHCKPNQPTNQGPQSVRIHWSG